MKAVKFVAAIKLVACLGFPAMSAEFATKDEAVAMVNKAVAYVKKEGAKKAYAEFDKKPGEFTDRDLYVLVYGTDGRVLARGSNAKLVGKDMTDAQDVDGKYYVKERLALAAKQKTFWQDYKFTNPVTKKIEPKQAYCEVLDQAGARSRSNGAATEGGSRAPSQGQRRAGEGRRRTGARAQPPGSGAKEPVRR